MSELDVVESKPSLPAPVYAQMMKSYIWLQTADGSIQQVGVPACSHNDTQNEARLQLLLLLPLLSCCCWFAVLLFAAAACMLHCSQLLLLLLVVAHACCTRCCGGCLHPPEQKPQPAPCCWCEL